MPERGQPILYVADLDGCAGLAKMSAEAVNDAFVAALEHAGATIVDRISHGFPGAGRTCILILAESHAVLHTWPETGTVHLDVFSCTARLKSLAAIEEMGRLLGAASVSVRETARASGYHTQTSA